MSLVVANYDTKIEYFTCLLEKLSVPGSHDDLIEIRGSLGYYMKTLKDSNHNDPIVEQLLHQIYDILQLEYSFETFNQQYMIYLRLLADREEKIESSKSNFFSKLSEIPKLKKSRWNLWGSYRQFIFGKCVVDVLNQEYGCELHPIWGCLLSPTGGIIGYANMQLLERKWNSYISLHSCVHDAGGYLYNYHNFKNTSYNYLNTWMTLFPGRSPMSCQFAGLRCWKKIVQNHQN